MQQRIVIELNERLQLDVQPAAVIKQRAMMIGNPPRPGIEIEARREIAGLSEASEFLEPVAAAQSPISPARTGIEFQHLNGVAGIAQFKCSGHAGQAGAEDQNRRASDVALSLMRPL